MRPYSVWRGDADGGTVEVGVGDAHRVLVAVVAAGGLDVIADLAIESEAATALAIRLAAALVLLATAGAGCAAAACTRFTSAGWMKGPFLRLLLTVVSAPYYFLRRRMMRRLEAFFLLRVR